MWGWLRGLWLRHVDWYCRPSQTELNEIRVLKQEIQTLKTEIAIWSGWYRSEKLDEEGIWVNFQQALKQVWRDSNASLCLPLPEMQSESGLPVTGYSFGTEALQAGDAEDLHGTKCSVQRRRVHKGNKRVRSGKKTRSRRESSSRLRRSV